MHYFLSNVQIIYKPAFLRLDIKKRIEKQLRVIYGF